MKLEQNMSTVVSHPFKKSLITELRILIAPATLLALARPRFGIQDRDLGDCGFGIEDSGLRIRD
jgi:hypothetical protein